MQENNARKLELFIQNGYYREAVLICGSILESVLKDNLKKIKGHGNLSPDELSKLAEHEKLIGKGKSITDFTLGQTVGLYREAKLLAITERLLGKDLKVSFEFFKGGRIDRMVDERNNAAHHEKLDYKPSESESTDFKNDLNKILVEFGYEPVIDETLVPDENIQKFPTRYTFELGGLKIRNIFIDENNRLWISDNEQELKIFDLSRPRPVNGKGITNKPWKKHFGFEWNGCYLCSDWEGGLYAFTQNKREKERQLRPSKFNHLPVHLLRKNKNNFLVAGTWDGKILVIDPTGQLQKTYQIDHLPTIIIDADESSLIVADQLGFVRQLSEGSVKILWKSEHRILDAWIIPFENDNDQLAILESKRIVCVNLYGESINVIDLNNEVVAFSHNEKDYWTSIALSGGIIEWLSWNPFRLIQNNRVNLNGSGFEAEEVKQLIVLDKPEMQHVHAAIGITVNGKIFSVKDLSINFYSHENIVQLVTDKSKHNLLMVYEDALLLDREFIPQIFNENK